MFYGLLFQFLMPTSFQNVSYFCPFQYVYLKQMTKAAVVIQNQFRSYYEHKRFKKNMESPSTSSGSAANSSGNGVGISSSAAAVAAAYRNYRESSLSASSARQSREGTPTSSALKYVSKNEK